ncbi:hypothetical protein V2J09_020697 [Rumex salicifolius]
MGFENNKNLFNWISVLGLLSQILIASSNSIEAQKTYYSHPSHGHSHGSGTSPPAHGVSCSPIPPAHHGGGGGYHHSPPAYIAPPTPVITPVTPTVPSPPVPTDPGSGHGPFPCTYWGSHPGMIWGVLGWWGTVGGVFGVTSLPGMTSSDPTSLTLQHVLTNPSNDGYSALYREAAASFLNSVAAPKQFPLTTSQVRSSFVAALASAKAAASQARVFRLANQGRLKLH